MAADELYVTAEPALRPVTLTGFTRARASLPLISEVSGRVQDVTCDIGDTIDPAGVFARIDDTFLRLELEQVKLKQDRLRAQIAFDEREVQRYDRLARESNAAAAQLDALKQTLGDNRNALLELAVEERIIRERLTRTTVPAPSGWRLTERNVEPGQWINAGEPLGKAANFKTLIVPYALTPEQHDVLLTSLRQRPGIRLWLSDLEQWVDASLRWTNPAFDPATRKVAIELEIASPLEPARGGLRAQLTLEVPELSGAVLLPESAVRRSYEEHWVYPVNGAPIQVLVLGRVAHDDGDRLRVVGPNIAPGDRFLAAVPTAAHDQAATDSH